VVVGLDCITGLQTARILHARGASVIGISSRRRHWATYTRACEDVVVADLGSGNLTKALQDLRPRLGGRRAVLIPCTDPAVARLAADQEVLRPWFVLPLGPLPLVQTLMDKTSFAQYAEDRGLPVPLTRVVGNEAELADAARRLVFPLMLKPPAKSPEWDRVVGAKVIRVADARTLVSTYERVSAQAPAVVVQEIIPGPETELYSCNAYFNASGQPLATFVARKLRQWPPDTGTSASGIECRNDEVLDVTLKLFGEAGYHGLAYLEMKKHAETGRLLIVEPNVGRPTGRSAIAEAGGVELVWTAYCDAAGLPLPVNRTQQYGSARWLDLRRDLQAAFVARRKGTLTWGEWFSSARQPTAHAIWSRQDPAPFVVDVIQAGAKGLLGLLRALKDRAAHAVATAFPGSDVP